MRERVKKVVYARDPQAGDDSEEAMAWEGERLMTVVRAVCAQSADPRQMVNEEEEEEEGGMASRKGACAWREAGRRCQWTGRGRGAAFCFMPCHKEATSHDV